MNNNELLLLPYLSEQVQKGQIALDNPIVMRIIDVDTKSIEHHQTVNGIQAILYTLLSRLTIIFNGLKDGHIV